MIMPITIFVSGHIDLTEDEFDKYYAPHIDTELAWNPDAHWVVGDSKGADVMAQRYLWSKGVKDVTVYHTSNHTGPLHNPHNYPTNGKYPNHTQKDAAMTRASVRDIAWVRPGREKSGTARNIQRRADIDRTIQSLINKRTYIA